MNAIKLTKRELLRIAIKKTASQLEKEAASLHEQGRNLRDQISETNKAYAKQVAEKCVEASDVSKALTKALEPFGIEVSHYLDDNKVKLYVNVEFPVSETDPEAKEKHEAQIKEMERERRELHERANDLSAKTRRMYDPYGKNPKKIEDEFLLHLLDNLNGDTVEHLKALGEAIVRQTETKE